MANPPVAEVSGVARRWGLQHVRPIHAGHAHPARVERIERRQLRMAKRPAVAPIDARSEAVTRRILDLVSLTPGWDGHGADPIATSTAVTALLIALGMLPAASSPSITPMADGALILRWTFENEVAVEIIVEEDERFPTYAMLTGTTDALMEEIALESEATLRSLLERRGRYDNPEIRTATYSVAESR